MLIDDYTDLIPSVNYTKPKYMEYLDAILTPAIDLGELVETMGYSFDIDNLAGDQMDIIGELVGVSRLLPVAPTVGDRSMDDDEYLMCIKMRIAQNEWDGTNGRAVELYKNVLGDTYNIYYIDNQDMSIDIMLGGTTNQREAEVLFLADVLLIPAGVKANAIITDEDASMSLKIGIGIGGQLEVVSANMILGE